jgi:hypothetical protein
MSFPGGGPVAVAAAVRRQLRLRVLTPGGGWRQGGRVGALDCARSGRPGYTSPAHARIGHVLSRMGPLWGNH